MTAKDESLTTDKADFSDYQTLNKKIEKHKRGGR